MAAYCRGHDLKIICGLTAYTQGSALGPTLGSKYGRTLRTFRYRNVKETISSWKNGKKTVFSCIFAFVLVFSCIQLVLYVKYANYSFIIIKSLCHIIIIENNTCTGMI